MEDRPALVGHGDRGRRRQIDLCGPRFLLLLLLLNQSVQQPEAAPLFGFGQAIVPAALNTAARVAALPVLGAGTSTVIRTTPHLSRVLSASSGGINAMGSAVGSGGSSSSLTTVALTGSQMIGPGLGAAGSNVVSGANQLVSTLSSSGSAAASSGGSVAASTGAQVLRGMATPLFQSATDLADETPRILSQMGRGIVNRGADFTDELLGAGAQAGSRGGLTPLADDWWTGAASQGAYQSSKQGAIFSGNLHGVAADLIEVVDDVAAAGGRTGASAASGAAATASQGAAGGVAAGISGSGGQAARHSLGQVIDRVLDSLRSGGSGVQAAATRTAGLGGGGLSGSGGAGLPGGAAAAAAAGARNPRSILGVLGTVGRAVLGTKRGQMFMLTLLGTGIGVGVNVHVAGETDDALSATVAEARERAEQATASALRSEKALELVLAHTANATGAAVSARDFALQVRELYYNKSISEEKMALIITRLTEALNTRGGLSTVSTIPPPGFVPGRAQFLSATPMFFENREWFYFTFLSPLGHQKAVLINTDSGELVEEEQSLPDWRPPRPTTLPLTHVRTTIPPYVRGQNYPVAVPSPSGDRDLFPARRRRTLEADAMDAAAVSETSSTTTTTTTTTTRPPKTAASSAVSGEDGTAGAASNTTATTTTTAPCPSARTAAIDLVKRLLAGLEVALPESDDAALEETTEPTEPTAPSTGVPATVSSIDPDLYPVRRRRQSGDMPSLRQFLAGLTGTLREAVEERLKNRILIAFLTRELERDLVTAERADDGSRNSGIVGTAEEGDRQKRAVPLLLLPFLPMITGFLTVKATAATAVAVTTATVSLTSTATGVALAAVQLAPVMGKLADPSSPPRTTEPPPTEPPPTASPVSRVPVEIFLSASIVADLEEWYHIGRYIDAVVEVEVRKGGDAGDDYVLTTDTLDRLLDRALFLAYEEDEARSLPSPRVKRSVLQNSQTPCPHMWMFPLIRLFGPAGLSRPFPSIFPGHPALLPARPISALGSIVATGIARAG